MNDLCVSKADLSKKEHCDALAYLVSVYMADPMGGTSDILSETQKKQMIIGLRNNLSTLVFLCSKGSTFIGAAVCFVGFSTFKARPLINIHDIVVLPEYRKLGAGLSLMKAVEEEAAMLNCCKVTLEVRMDNYVAKHLYSKCGFSSGDYPMEFWTKYL